MKTVIMIFVVLLSTTLSKDIFAQTKKVETVEFAVSGTCDMCEERIENAALLKGVMMAEWSKQNQILKVIYKTKKVALNEIKASILKAGHDVGEQKADSAAYSELPACCKFNDDVEVH